MILQVEHIEKKLGKIQVLRDVSFEVHAGQLVGIVGENGSGKSTLLKIIAGEWKSDKGNVNINGSKGYCPQQSLLFSLLTVEEHFSYFATAYGMTYEQQLKRSSSLMAYFNFKNSINQKVANLSGGTQQKLNLSIALLHQPQLLILDEPYTGFDWETYMKFWEYTKLLQSEGCAILVVSHLLTERERFDHIFTLKEGYLQ